MKSNLIFTSYACLKTEIFLPKTYKSKFNDINPYQNLSAGRLRLDHFNVISFIILWIEVNLSWGSNYHEGQITPEKSESEKYWLSWPLSTYMIGTILADHVIFDQIIKLFQNTYLKKKANLFGHWSFQK